MISMSQFANSSNLAYTTKDVQTAANSLKSNEPDVYVFTLFEKEPYPIRLFALTLQGIVNRQRDTGQVYLIFNDYDWDWLYYYHSRFNISYEVVQNWYDLLNLTKDCIKGYVVYDKNVPYSTDVAITIAGLNDSIVISPDMIENIEKCMIPKDVDLRGKFTGMSRTQIYEWGYENLWPRCSRKIIGNTYRPPNFVTINLTSYLQTSSTVYVKFTDATPSDGLGADLYCAELEIGENITYIVPGTSDEHKYMYDFADSWLSFEGYRIADASQHWIYKFDLGKNIQAQLILEIYQQYVVTISTNPTGSWTEVARCSNVEPSYLVSASTPEINDYLVTSRAFVMCMSSTLPDDHELKGKFLSEMQPFGLVLGWVFEGNEEPYVEQASENGQLVVASAGPGSATPNISFHCKIKPSITFRQSETDPEEIQVENKTYITFIHSDGDALSKLNSRFNELWDLRGKFPVGWTIQPLALDLEPGMMQYYYEHLSRNDCFIAAVSGIGYTFPDVFSPDLFQEYLELTHQYLEKADLRTLFVSPYDYTNPYSTDIINDYGKYLNSCVGFLDGYWPRSGETTLNGISVWFKTQYNVGQQSSQEILQTLEGIANQSAQRPLFVSVNVQPFSWPTPVDDNIYAAIQNLDPNKYEVVNPYKLARLALKYFGVSYHDVALINIEPYRAILDNASSTSINVTCFNEGDITESFNVTLYANETIVQTRTMSLFNGTSTSITFNWNTTDFQLGNYTLKAVAGPVENETFLSNNELVDGSIKISIKGDINGSGKVDMKDVSYVARRFMCLPGDSLWDSNADINEDLKIDMKDISTTAKQFGT